MTVISAVVVSAFAWSGVYTSRAKAGTDIEVSLLFSRMDRVVWLPFISTTRYSQLLQALKLCGIRTLYTHERAAGGNTWYLMTRYEY